MNSLQKRKELISKIPVLTVMLPLLLLMHRDRPIMAVLSEKTLIYPKGLNVTSAIK